MNFSEHQEMITAIYKRFERLRLRAVLTRNRMKRGTPKAAMLAGKVKAYTELLCLITDKYPNHLTPDFKPLPREPIQDEEPDVEP